MRNELLRYACLSVICLLGSTPAWAQSQTVDVLTWNVHKPSDPAIVRQQMEFVAGLNPRPDIVVLQEVRTNLKSVYRDELQQATPEADTWVGVDAFQATCAFPAGPNNTCTTFGTTGVLILTRFTMEQWESRMFMYPDQYAPGRPAVRARINANGTILNVFTAHLPSGWEPETRTSRDLMVADLKSWAAPFSSPRLFGGDFNDWAGNPPIDRMTDGPGGPYVDAWATLRPTENGYTWGGSERVDYWFSDENGSATPTQVSLPPSGSLSDHFAVFATYQISGQSPPPPAAGVRINFQTAGSAPAGYLADTGLTYAARGNGQTYGWNIDHTGETRNRNAPTSPDEQHDTLIYMQRLSADALWEIAVPAGWYQVRVVAGDPTYQNNTMKIAVEGALVVDGFTTSAAPWIDQTARVQVTDGRLTIANAQGADGNKICFIEFFREIVKINFQMAGPAPAGFVADSGLTYGARGNGWTYGWNIDHTGEARDRNAPTSPDEQHDTLIYMQRISPNALWEIEVPSGWYQVRVVAGDPTYQNNTMKIAVEGALVVDGFTTSAAPWIDRTALVQVIDGRLTIANAQGADGNKICFIEITQ